jgi:hypothetical protein
MGRREMHIGFWGEPEGKRPLGRPKFRWEDNIKMDLKRECSSMDWIDLAKTGTSGDLVNVIMNLWVP